MSSHKRLDMGAYTILTNPYLIALGIPVLLIISGAFAKKLVRGSTWQRTDFYLGVELSLASMASALVYVFDLTKSANTTTNAPPLIGNEIAATTTFLTVCFFLLLWILTTHQDWEKQSSNPKGQLIRLGIIANFIGAGLLAAFVLLVKGV